MHFRPTLEWKLEGQSKKRLKLQNPSFFFFSSLILFCGPTFSPCSNGKGIYIFLWSGGGGGGGGRDCDSDRIFTLAPARLCRRDEKRSRVQISKAPLLVQFKQTHGVWADVAQTVAFFHDWATSNIWPWFGSFLVTLREIFVSNSSVKNGMSLSEHFFWKKKWKEELYMIKKCSLSDMPFLTEEFETKISCKVAKKDPNHGQILDVAQSWKKATVWATSAHTPWVCLNWTKSGIFEIRTLDLFYSCGSLVGAV